MSFQDLHTTKLGNIGERYALEFANSKNSVPYIPALEGSAPVDSLMIKRDNYRVWSCEVKTKGRLKYYEKTGYDLNDHQSYCSMPFPVYILFVDHITQSIYGAWVKDLDKDSSKEILKDKLAIFSLTAMTEHRKLEVIEVEELVKASYSNYI